MYEGNVILEAFDFSTGPLRGPNDPADVKTMYSEALKERTA
jgi:hypothetical protein